ncbi:hypothetical protein ACHQM5_029294 [Ranunculus cassubicifolius]
MGLRVSKLSKVFTGNGFRRLEGVQMIPKGYIPVCVGIDNETKRFMVHRKSLVDVEFLQLLCKSAEEYGFRNEGVLRIPCDAKEFEGWVMRGTRRRKVLRVRPT